MPDLAKIAEALARQGQKGDNTLIHVQRDQLPKIAEALGHAGKMNPKTGLLGFFDDMGKGSYDGDGGWSGGFDSSPDGGNDGNGSGDDQKQNAPAESAPDPVGDAARVAAQKEFQATVTGPNLVRDAADPISKVIDALTPFTPTETIDPFGRVVGSGASVSLNPIGMVAGLVAGPLAGVAAGVLGDAVGMPRVELGNIDFGAAGLSNRDSAPAGFDAAQNMKETGNVVGNVPGGRDGANATDSQQAQTEKPAEPKTDKVTASKVADLLAAFKYANMPKFAMMNQDFGSEMIRRG